MKVRRLMAFAILLGPSPVQGQAGAIPIWRLSPAPLLSLGGEDHPEFEFLRIGSLQLRPDGSLLVANGDPPEILLVSSAGALQRRLGRKGDGPGEFRFIGWAAARGDSVVAFDQGPRRLTVFTADGKVLPTLPLPTAGTTYGLGISGRLVCGAWLAQPIQAMGRSGRNGLSRDSTQVMLLSPGLERVAATLGPFPGLTTVVMVSGEGATRRMAVGGAMFGATLLSGVADSVIYTIDTATPDLHLWDCAGKPRRTIALPIPERPLSQTVAGQLKEQALASSRSEMERAFVETRYKPDYLPERLPRVRSIVSGTNGELWIEQYEADPNASSTWWIVDLTGKVRARLQSPPRFRIRSVLRDRLAGVHLDADGVESVRVYQLLW